MKTLKKLGLIFSAIAFCLSIAVSASYAQPGKAKYEGNRGKHKGWEKQADRRQAMRSGVDYRRYNQDGRYYDRSGRRITAQEYRRLQRQRSRISRSRDRFYRDGSLSDKERQKLAKQRSKFRRSVRKARSS